METIIGIDLGTTNSEVAIIRDGRPVVLPDEEGDPILPSVVGLDPQGRLLVGRAARNQFVLAPERTIRSIKRRMGEEVTVTLGDQKYTPQEISAIILRTLKQRAEKALGTAVTKAVITVPAFFNDGQRAATREAGELAGLEVVRIINEPTAAVLTYDPHPPEMERLLVYDLGGGTFDVSIAQVESGVVEILSSHGDTHLGGDDFDQRLLDFVCDRFLSQHGIDLREALVARSRVLRAVEEAKKMLSFEAIAQIEEEFIAEKNGVPLHLIVEIDREDYEGLIEPLLAKTLTCLDQSLSDANLQANQIDKVVLVGGATRTPLVHRLLQDRLGRPVHSEIEPDLAVAMGAAVQGGLIAGVEVGAILVDITPHTLGIEALGELNGIPSVHTFSPIIERNTPLPASRTEIYGTVSDEQKCGADPRLPGGERRHAVQHAGRRVHDRGSGPGRRRQPDPRAARPRPERHPQGNRHRAAHRPGAAGDDRQRDRTVPDPPADQRRRSPRGDLRDGRNALFGGPRRRRIAARPRWGRHLPPAWGRRSRRPRR